MGIWGIQISNGVENGKGHIFSISILTSPLTCSNFLSPKFFFFVFFSFFWLFFLFNFKFLNPYHLEVDKNRNGSTQPIKPKYSIRFSLVFSHMAVMCKKTMTVSLVFRLVLHKLNQTKPHIYNLLLCHIILSYSYVHFLCTSNLPTSLQFTQISMI